jgi:hypothetical protein
MELTSSALLVLSIKVARKSSENTMGISVKSGYKKQLEMQSRKAVKINVQNNYLPYQTLEIEILNS